MTPFDLLLTSLQCSPVCVGRAARHVLCMLRMSVQMWDAMTRHDTLLTGWEPEYTDPMPMLYTSVHLKLPLLAIKVGVLV